MNRRSTPRLATALLRRFAPNDEAVVGDLDEAYQQGQSKAWYWRQALAFLLAKSSREVGVHPFRSIGAVAFGWGTLVFAFVVLGDRLTDGLAAVILPGWTHDAAYKTKVWWPFQISSFVVSYAGFALSSWCVARVNRQNGGAPLFIYIVTVWLAIAV